MADKDRFLSGNSPLIVFIGPSGCGKSMVLMSLVEYLQANVDGLAICPNKGYNPSDNLYDAKCDKFMSILEANSSKRNGWKNALPGTLDEILIDIRRTSKAGETLYRLLEAPGEHFFSLKKPKKPMRDYLQSILTSGSERFEKYPIYFVVLLDLYLSSDDKENKYNFKNPDDDVRLAYENRIVDIIKSAYDSRRGDKVIMLLNKSDLIDGSIKDKIKSVVTQYYKKIEKKLTKKIMVFFSDTLYGDIIPFTSGQWDEEDDDEGKLHPIYKSTPTSDACAKALWERISNRFKN